MEHGIGQLRRLAFAIAVALAIIASFVLGQHTSKTPSSSKASHRVLYYVDPMHPAYKSDRPGIAPDCGMQLEPVYADDVEKIPITPSAGQISPGVVTIDGARQQLLGIRLATAERSAANHTFRVVGRVTPEDTREYRINPGVEGFVRGTFNDSVGTFVKKDQKLASYYSPEFLSVVSGFLAASQGVPGSVGTDGSRTMPFPGAVSKQGVSSLQGYSDRLRNLGMSDVQIKKVADTHQLPDSIDVVAPVDGIILARNISPGQHFDHGMEFYRIADLGHVWVVAEVEEQEVATLRPGRLAKIILAGEGHELAARVADSLPQSEAGGGSVKLRLEVENPKLLLRPDMLVDVELPVHLPPGVTVPLDALVDSGAKSRVYVERGEGVFEPREVETGWRYGDQVEIRKGVRPGERVVASATFLVDSESRLGSPQPSQTNDNPATLTGHTAAGKMVIDPNCGMAIDPAVAVKSGNNLEIQGTTYYFCSKKCKEKYQNNSVNIASKQASGR